MAIKMGKEIQKGKMFHKARLNPHLRPRGSVPSPSPINSKAGTTQQHQTGPATLPLGVEEKVNAIIVGQKLTPDHQTLLHLLGDTGQVMWTLAIAPWSRVQTSGVNT